MIIEHLMKLDIILKIVGCTVTKKLDHNNYTIHEFRHTHATQLIEAGFSILDVSKRLGHASPQTTVNVYAHAVAGADKNLGNFFDPPKKDSSQME